MSSQEQQQEEVEVLQSIYDGDANFKQVNPTTYQYKFGEDGSYRSFVVELAWGETYPEVLATINLDVFYNKHLIDSVRTAIKSGLEEQMADLIGMPMTFTLFEWVKDNLDSLLADQPDAPIPVASSQASPTASAGDQPAAVKKERKEQLTKAQKRRMMDKFGANAEERPRGWNWVDVVKHLSQTGGQKTETS